MFRYVIGSLISLILLLVLFVVFGSHLFVAIGKFFYWIADLIEKTGFVFVYDKISTFFGWG